jgi:DNA-binding MarR family transcriptional regulator
VTTTASSPTASGQAAQAEPTVGSTTTAADLLAALRTIVKRLDSTPLPTKNPDAERKDSSLAPRHVAALMQVVSDERLSVTTLASRLGISLATASQVVTDLETTGVVERIEDPTDRRRTLVQVAEAHRQLADALLDTRLRPVQRALDRMKPGEQRAVVKGLELIAEELGTGN